MSSFDVFEGTPAGTTPGRHPRRLTRLIAPLCTLTGLVLVANAANPAVLTSLSTLELLGIVVLAVFPPLLLFTLRFDRSEQLPIRPEAPAHRAQARSTTHHAHQRPARTHPRLVPETGPEPGVHEHAV